MNVHRTLTTARKLVPTRQAALLAAVTLALNSATEYVKISMNAQGQIMAAVLRYVPTQQAALLAAVTLAIPTPQVDNASWSPAPQTVRANQTAFVAAAIPASCLGVPARTHLNGQAPVSISMNAQRQIMAAVRRSVPTRQAALMLSVK